MADGPPHNLRSLQDRLRNHTRETQLPFGRVQRLLGVLVVGEMLRGQDLDLGVVKGGSNLEARLGIAATRASSDLDIVRVQSIERLRDSMAEALEAGWHGFSGRIVDRGPIGAPVPDAYQPHRLEVKLEYRGQRGAGTITLEVAVEEIDALEHVDAVTSEDGQAIFDAVGLPLPGPLPALAQHQQIAQKLHACTAPDEGGWVNDRAHDLVDLQLAHRSYDGTLAEIRATCERLFAARRRHPWPPKVTVRDGWSQRYAEESAGLDVCADVEDAVAWANDLVARIARA
ncbi:nucleotidyl transferase AbiEii/AbiGii toxin family protein [Egibacter rhizosphaerae]|nr:nucleotidyl transferase AbiEii/AbiGii toxin family protein [Egibacter rhizosphaerae]